MTESVKKRLRIDEKGKELLIHAIQDRDTKELKLLIEHFEKHGHDLKSVAKCDHDSNFNNCILLLAMKTKKADLVDLLLSRGLCTDDKKIHDFLIHEAIKIRNLPVMLKLKEYGFLQESTCDHEVSPLLELVALGRLDWLLLFHRAGVSFEEKPQKVPLLHFALSQSSITKKLFKFLLYLGANIEERNDEDLTPLHFLGTRKAEMSRRRKARFAKILLKFGANPNSWSESKQENVLHTAVLGKNPHLVEVLIMYGADVNLKDGCESTALELCTEKIKNQLSINDPFNSICFVLMKEIIRLEFREEYLDPDLLSNKSDLKIYYISQDSLLRDMYKVKITGKISMQDILMANENKLTTLMRNPKISEYLDSDRACNFASWNQVIRFRAKKGRERDILLTRCEKPFKEILKWEAPDLIVDKIFSYLSRTDLRSFYTAIYPGGFLEKIKTEDESTESEKDAESNTEDESEIEVDKKDENSEDDENVSFPDSEAELRDGNENEPCCLQ